MKLTVTIWTDDIKAHAGFEQRFPDVRFLFATTHNDFERYAIESDVIYFGKRHHRDMLENTKRLRWLHVAATGLDQLKPLDTLPERLVVTNMPGLNAEMMADYVIGMLIALSWNLPKLQQQQRQHTWQSWHVPRLEGKTVLILGLGNVGLATARRAVAHRLTVWGVRHQAHPAPFVERVFTLKDLPDILPHADYLVLALPLNEQTSRVISREALTYVKPGVIIVNVGRGELIDETALLDALDTGHVARAALDVFRQEPLPSDHPFWERPDILITPHMAAFSDDYRQRSADVFATNLQRYLQGKPLKHLVKYKP